MPTITLNAEEFSQRGQSISNLLRPISRVSSGPAYQIKQSLSEAIIGTHDGSPSISGYRDWRFSTGHSGISAMYFEIWVPEDAHAELWYLHNAYLTIFRRPYPRAEENELLSLHCDPEELDVEDDSKGIYKRGPHLHIKAADEPIPKAHLALARGHLSQVLSSSAQLTEALDWSIQMIKDEILDRIR